MNLETGSGEEEGGDDMTEAHLPDVLTSLVVWKSRLEGSQRMPAGVWDWDKMACIIFKIIPVIHILNI